VWPLLIGLSNDPQDVEDYEQFITKHDYTEQVAKDVERSLWKLVSGTTVSCSAHHVGKRQRERSREQLSNIMNAILSQHPELHYFQVCCNCLHS
jgi:hypothetical protein